MAKTLKDILEVAKPVSPADIKFVAKHTIKVTPDANKNGDDVFKGKTKAHKRSPNHGYDVGADEKVYEAAKAATLSALTGKASPIDDYADMIAKFKAKGGAVTKVAAEVPDEKKTASLSATFGKGGGKGGSALATGEYASMNKTDAAYNAKQALARKRAAGMKEEAELNEVALKYAPANDRKHAHALANQHREKNPSEVARVMNTKDGYKVAYTGPKLNTNLGESYEELDEGVAKDHYDTHHKRAMAALNDIGKNLMKQKAMCDKSDNKWAHQDNAWAMKDISRQLEDMVQNSAQRTENMTPVPMSQPSIRGY